MGSVAVVQRFHAPCERVDETVCVDIARLVKSQSQIDRTALENGTLDSLRVGVGDLRNVLGDFLN